MSNTAIETKYTIGGEKVTGSWGTEENPGGPLGVPLQVFVTEGRRIPHTIIFDTLEEVAAARARNLEAMDRQIAKNRALRARLAAEVVA